jgi:enamine deaminase RidA (YjgF/YER057c/UK114 family)
MLRTWCHTGGYWEGVAGYARAVRVDNHVWISGCTATQDESGNVIQDPAEQTRRTIDQIEHVVQSMGGSLSDVVQTRIYVRDLKHIAAIAQAHGDRFREIRPANMLAQVGLSDPILVEIEAEAIIGSGEHRQEIPLQ